MVELAKINMSLLSHVDKNSGIGIKLNEKSWSKYESMKCLHNFKHATGYPDTKSCMASHFVSTNDRSTYIGY